MKLKKLIITSVLAAFLCSAFIMLAAPQDERAAAFNGYGGVLRHMAYNPSYIYDFDFEGIEEDIQLLPEGETTVWIRFQDWQVYTAAYNLESSFVAELEYFEEVYMEFYLIMLNGNDDGELELYLPIYRGNDIGSFGFFYNFNSYFIDYMERYGWNEIYIAVCMDYPDHYSMYTPKFRFGYTSVDYGDQLWRYGSWDNEFPEYVNPDAYVYKRFEPQYTGDHILRYTGAEVDSFLELVVYQDSILHNAYTDGYGLPYPMEYWDHYGEAEHISTIFLEEDLIYYFAMPVKYFEDGIYPLSVHRFETLYDSSTDSYFNGEIVYFQPEVDYKDIILSSENYQYPYHSDAKFIVWPETGYRLSPYHLRDVNSGEYMIRSEVLGGIVSNYVYDSGKRGRVIERNHEITVFIEDDMDAPKAPFRKDLVMYHSNRTLHPINENIYFVKTKMNIVVDFPVSAYPFFFTSGDVEFYMDIVIKDWSHSFTLKAADGNPIPYSQEYIGGYRVYRFKFDQALKQRLQTHGSYFLIELINCTVTPRAVNFQMYVY